MRTGVTVVCPREGLARDEPVFAGSHTFDSNGEMTGLEWIREAGVQQLGHILAPFPNGGCP